LPGTKEKYGCSRPTTHQRWSPYSVRQYDRPACHPTMLEEAAGILLQGASIWVNTFEPSWINWNRCASASSFLRWGLLEPHHSVRQPGYLLCEKRPLGFASPPHDGFALLAALPRKKRCTNVTLTMTERKASVRGVEVRVSLADGWHQPRPPAMRPASGKYFRRSIASTPRAGPKARNANAHRHPTASSSSGISHIVTAVRV
jgi:hypothetical protein